MCPETAESRSLCHEIAEEFREAAGWISEGLTPSEIRRFLADLHAKKLARYGLTLHSATAATGHVLFSLRHARNGELCASINVDPRTGEALIQHTCL